MILSHGDKIQVENIIILVYFEGWTAIGIRYTRLWNYVELFWNSFDNGPSSIVLYLEMQAEADDFRSRFTPRFI